MNLAIGGLAQRLLAWKNKNENKLKKYLDNKKTFDTLAAWKTK
jgi:hypothetical protein